MGYNDSPAEVLKLYGSVQVTGHELKCTEVFQARNQVLVRNGQRQ